MKAKFTAIIFSDCLSSLVAVIVWLIILIDINLPYNKMKIGNYQKEHQGFTLTGERLPYKVLQLVFMHRGCPSSTSGN